MFVLCWGAVDQKLFQKFHVFELFQEFHVFNYCNGQTQNKHLLPDAVLTFIYFFEVEFEAE